MGKGTIQGGGSQGQYTIRLDWNVDRLSAELARLTSRIAGYATYIASLPEGDRKAAAELEKTSLERRQAMVESYLAAFQADDRTAWCADLTEDLTGEVGTIEVPGEPERVVIQPGWEGNASYDAGRDGQLEAPAAGTPAGTFFNLALLPAWQKHMPTFRTGTITALDGNLADVALDTATSSQQDLNVNQSPTLSSVPISYMSCDEIAFAVGDKVVVEFQNQDWDDPLIIGFKDHPRTCTTFLVLRCGGEAEEERRYIIWNIQQHRLVEIDGVTFPCPWADIEDWLSEKEEQSSSQWLTIGTGPSSNDSYYGGNYTWVDWPYCTYTESSDVDAAYYSWVYQDPDWGGAWVRHYDECFTGGPWEAEVDEECRVDFDDVTWQGLAGHTLKRYGTDWRKCQLEIHSCDPDDWSVEDCGPWDDYAHCPWDHAFTYWYWITRARYVEGYKDLFGTAPLLNADGTDGYFFTTIFEEMAVKAERESINNIIGPTNGLPCDYLWDDIRWQDILERFDAGYLADPQTLGVTATRGNDKTISSKYIFQTHLGEIGRLTGNQTQGPTYADQTEGHRLQGSEQRVIMTRHGSNAAVQIYVYQALTETYDGGWITDDHHIFVQAAADMYAEGGGITADPTASTLSEALAAAVQDLIEAYYTARGYSSNTLLNISLEGSFYQ